jgi:hypothetical protein
MDFIKKLEINQVPETRLFAVTADGATFYNVETVTYTPGQTAALFMRGPDGKITGIARGKLHYTRTEIVMRWAGPDPDGYPVPPMLVYNVLINGMPVSSNSTAGKHIRGREQ